MGEQAVDAALSGDTLIVVGSADATFACGVSIAKDVAIVGQAMPVFDCGGNGRALSFVGVAVNISGLAVRNGRVSGFGGAVLISNATSVTIADSAFERNSATVGGAVGIHSASG